MPEPNPPLVLHANWSPGPRPPHGALHLWAERATPEPPARARGRPRSIPHPFALPADALAVALDEAGVSADEATPGEIRLQLPTTGNLPLPSPAVVHGWDELVDAPYSGLKTVDAPSLVMDPLSALAWLETFPAASERPAYLAPGDDLRFWARAARFAVALLAGERFLPDLARDEDGTYRARWRPALDRPEDAARRRRLLEAMPPVVRAGGGDGGDDPPSAASDILDRFVTAVTDAAVRAWSASGSSSDRAPQGDRPAASWLRALLAADPDTPVEGPSFTLERLSAGHRRWLAQLEAAGDTAFRVCFQLDVPQTAEERWRLTFQLQATDDPSLLIPADRVWAAEDGALEVVGRRFEGPQERLLTGLGYAARLFEPLSRALDAPEPTGATLETAEAYTFLREAAPLLEASGFALRTPPWWNKRGTRVAARVTVDSGAAPIGHGVLSRDRLLQYDWQLVLGDEPLSREEFEALVALKTPLVKVRGEWVALDPEDVEAAIRFWERRQTEEISTLDALTMALAGEGEIDGLPVADVELDGWLGELQATLQAEDDRAPAPVPDGLEATLRPYQTDGFRWLAKLHRFGLGACLADDMGLGKTVQAIALLLHERETGRQTAAGNGDGAAGQLGGDGSVDAGPALVVCPTSVAGNWGHELARFAPTLDVLLHHGPGRAADEALHAQAKAHDVVITSYGTLRQDVEALSDVGWTTVVLDEAQNIKNPAAKVTRAARSLAADFRLALSGTPIENRLSELWSILEFLNPGYLGSRKRFREQFGLPVERYEDDEAAERLSRLVSPFVLRRVKSDPDVIADLPDKLEAKVYCSLTPEQATLYQAVVDESLQQVAAAEESGEDMQRRGLVLALLGRLKQICNHPALFLADGSDLPGRSGKLARLTEMLEEATAAGDRALVFTQYATMGELLQGHLRTTLGREVLFLHGGTSRTARERMVERFNGPDGPPVFVLSLKAGGVGLNLTAASHVFHFDRWWNPAVEEQATDRAYRIGQTKQVQVHKLMCLGTLEEHIDELIESKRALAERVISGGAAALSELSTAELREVLTLRGATIDEEGNG